MRFLPLVVQGQPVRIAYMDGPDVGHVPHLEAPALFGRAMLAFLAEP